ncbi:MAG: DUF4276 family protein [Planctomycetota bacterium]
MKSVELRVLCEGDTEWNFVVQVLAPHLSPVRVFAKPQLLSPFGGIRKFQRLKKDIQNELGRLRAHQFVTTMFDLYALPKDYPDRGSVDGESGVQRALRVEAGMKRELNNPRFLPYVQVHEFEALVFVEVDRLRDQYPDGEADAAVQLLRSSVGNLAPEDIDDGPQTAPSKRIERVLPQYAYAKSINGPQVAAAIGMNRLRKACPHFNEWITRLERLQGRARGSGSRRRT